MALASRGGYTLIELLIVCVLIAVVVAMTMPQYLRRVETARFDEGDVLGAAQIMEHLFLLGGDYNFGFGQNLAADRDAAF